MCGLTLFFVSLSVRHKSTLVKGSMAIALIYAERDKSNLIETMQNLRRNRGRIYINWHKRENSPIKEERPSLEPVKIMPTEVLRRKKMPLFKACHLKPPLPGSHLFQ